MSRVCSKNSDPGRNRVQKDLRGGVAPLRNSLTEKEKSHFLYAFLARLKRLHLPILHMVLEPTAPPPSFIKTTE